MSRGDIDLGDLTLEAGAGVEEDAPAEAGQSVPGADPEDHVLALEGGRHALDSPLELVPRQLRVLGEKGLLVLVELEEQRADEPVLAGIEAHDGRLPHLR